MRNYKLICQAFLLSICLFLINCSDDNGVKEILPRTPSNPTPANGSMITGIRCILIWECSHPEGKALTYDVYFGGNSTPGIFLTGISADSVNLSFLDYGHTYYWKVVAVDESNKSVSGPIWSFATPPYIDVPPEIPSAPIPANGQTGVSRTATLYWHCISPADLVYFDVYLCNDSIPNIMASNQFNPQFSPDTLRDSTLYFWRIVARTTHYETTGPIWHFTTGSVTN
jgi:hypothetical protein